MRRIRRELFHGFAEPAEGYGQKQECDNQGGGCRDNGKGDYHGAEGKDGCGENAGYFNGAVENGEEYTETQNPAAGIHIRRPRPAPEGKLR